LKSDFSVQINGNSDFTFNKQIFLLELMRIFLQEEIFWKKISKDQKMEVDLKTQIEKELKAEFEDSRVLDRSLFSSQNRVFHHSEYGLRIFITGDQR